MRTNDEKYKTVIEYNTFFFNNKQFEEGYEAYVNSIKELLVGLRNRILNDRLKKEHFEELIFKNEHGLVALLALTGFSNESLKRIITFIRIIDDENLNKLVNKEKWNIKADKDDTQEWSDGKIQKLILENEGFRKGIINLFFEGSTLPVLYNALPLFEIKKLSLSKLSFEMDAIIDTLVRYKEKGSYSGQKDNNPEVVIEHILNERKISYEKGDLTELIVNAPITKRTMDFIIPLKNNPKLIIESSYLVTTSSGQGDKSKTEISIDALIKTHYPQARFIGFVDGIGWYVRKKDLKRMITAYEEVFTYHPDELNRFVKYIESIGL